MRMLKSDIVFTLNQEPLVNGIVVTSEEGQILDVLSSEIAGEELGMEYFPGAICPGFVNTHCHLELSYALGKIEKNKGINHFISSLEMLKKELDQKTKQTAIANAEKEMFENGTSAVGDISNTADTKHIKSLSKLHFYNFIETFGSLESRANANFDIAYQVYRQFKEPKSIVPHATYSVSMPLFEKIATFEGNQHKTISMHHLESVSELDYFKTAKGEIVDRMEKWGIPLPSFIPSGLSPFSTIKKYFHTENQLLLVHNTVLEKEELKRICDSNPNIWFVLCPNSNEFIENLQPNYSIFLEKTNHICLGTDSLASNTQLSILEEIKRILLDNERITFDELLHWACLNGAKALGFDSFLGSIEVGKFPGIVQITDFDLKSMKIRKQSISKRIL